MARAGGVRSRLLSARGLGCLPNKPLKPEEAGKGREKGHEDSIFWRGDDGGEMAGVDGLENDAQLRCLWLELYSFMFDALQVVR